MQITYLYVELVHTDHWCTSTNMLGLLVCLLSVTGGLIALTPDEIKLSKAQQQFSADLFHAISGNASLAENVFFSPYSVYSTLLTLYVASAGKTEKSFEEFLKFSKDSKPCKDFITQKVLSEPFSHQSKEYELQSLDRIFYSPDIKVKAGKVKKFADKLAVFKTTDKRADEVNSWVSDNTNGIIPKLLDELTDGSLLVSVNAAYFNGLWTNPLTGKQTKDAFKLSDGTSRKTLFMSGKDTALFQSMMDPELKSQVLNLPYKGRDISMLVILPSKDPKAKTPASVSDVVKKLTNAKFQAILSTIKTQKMSPLDIMIPKFKSKGKYELKKVMESMGNSDLFTQAMDLTNIFETPDLKLSKIIHEAKVNVYENGTQAAAASAAVTMNGPPPQAFHADHPFIFIIYDWAQNVVHYMGILNNPE